MTGLRSYTRDTSLLTHAGDVELTPPSPDEFQSTLLAKLDAESAQRTVSVQLSYARWKPGVACTAAYELLAANGETSIAVWRRHLDSKRNGSEGERGDKRRLGHQHETKLRLHFDAARQAFLWLFPADRRLPGAARAQDIGRLARFLQAHALESGWRVRRKHVTQVLVRYRPERRALYRMGVKLMGPSRDESCGEKRRIELAVRALERSAAARTVAARQALARSAGHSRLQPHLVAHESRTGLLFESWLDVEPCSALEFSHAPEAGALLAELHATPGWEAAPASPLADDDHLEALFECFPELPARPRIRRTVDEPSGFVHGDFHPDQIAFGRTDGEAHLLDLDAVGAGDRHDDLAAWIADHLVATSDFDAATGRLLDTYTACGASAPNAIRLGRAIARELMHRAAAPLRRLETDAVPKAAARLELASEVLRTHGGRP